MSRHGPDCRVRERPLPMTVALLLAAGSGERLGAGRPKALVELAGQPLVQWSIQALQGSPHIDRIVVALRRGSRRSPGCWPWREALSARTPCAGPSPQPALAIPCSSTTQPGRC